MDDDNWALITGQATTVYLEVPFEMIWRRIGKSPSRPLISGRTASEVEALFERRRARYEQAEHRVDGDRPPKEVAEDVQNLWSA
jgi:shikimate kinase